MLSPYIYTTCLIIDVFYRDAEIMRLKQEKKAGGGAETGGGAEGGASASK